MSTNGLLLIRKGFPALAHAVLVVYFRAGILVGHPGFTSPSGRHCDPVFAIGSQNPVKSREIARGFGTSAANSAIKVCPAYAGTDFHIRARGKESIIGLSVHLDEGGQQ